MTLTILGRPGTKKNRPQLFRNKRTGKPMLIQSKEARAWEASAVTQLRLQWKGPALTVPCRLDCIFYVHPQQRGDTTNYASALSDALEHAGVVANDRQFNVVRAERIVDRDTPRVECRVTPS